ncbi:MAG: sodium:proton antiporter [Candidatus Micrarchaeaceae archaeon]
MPAETIAEITLTFFIMMIATAQLIALKLKIPYTLVLVFVGIGVTALSTLALSPGVIQLAVGSIRSLYSQLVGTGLFVGLVVPPLIFEAMIHIRRRELVVVFRPALLLATIGVVVSTIVAGVVVWKIANLPLFPSLLFASIVAPTDTVTVLQIFRHIKVPARLSALMDIEAAFNDASGIVLFTILLSTAGLLHSFSILNGIGTFAYDFIGGVAVGLAIAIAFKWIHSRIDDRLASITLTIAGVYGSYVIASSIGASGLIAVAIVGLYFGNSTMRFAVSENVKSSILSFWEIAAFMGNAVAFMLIGFETNLVLFFEAALVIFVAYLATIIARIATVYPIFGALRRFGQEIPSKWSAIATMGGIRGALSIALLATLAGSGILDQNSLAIITSMVIGVVFISIIVQVPLLSRHTSMVYGKAGQVS